MSKFLAVGWDSPSIPRVSHRSPHKENPKEGAWSANCNDFGKKEGKYFHSK